MKCQNGTSSNTYGGRRKLPYVYTEHWVVALAGVIKSEIAAKASVDITRNFIEMRKIVSQICHFNPDLYSEGIFIFHYPKSFFQELKVYETH